MVSTREKFLRIARFQSTGELMLPSVWQWFWGEALDRWQKEGLPPGVHVQEYLGFERAEMIPMNMSVIPRFEVETLEEDATHKVIRDGEGAKKKVMKEHRATSMDQWLEYPVRDRKTWEDYKKRLDPHAAARYPVWWEQKKEEYKRRSYPLGIGVGSFFGWTRNWIGIQNLSYLTVDDPALIEEIGEHLEYFIIEAIKPALSEIQFDFAHFWEDMAWKGGSLVSIDFVRKYMVPHYKKVTDLLHDHGIDIITLDSDGDVSELIPVWLECGINGILPNEVAANVDVVEMRKQYGKDLVISGGIDKRALAGTKKQVEDEVMSKVPYLLSEGGYFPSIDHAVPPDVPFENYAYYLELLRQAAA